MFLLLFSLIFINQPIPGQTRLESFQQEAERALGRHVNIVETEDVGKNLGETGCELDPVVIRIKPGLDTRLREAVVAHELGHALLCGRGISIVMGPPKQPVDLSASPIANSLSSSIGSCYLDPLADAEAERRGFAPGLAVDELFQATKRHTREEIHRWIDEFGDLGLDLVAINLYCVDLRPHSFRMSELEKIYQGEPSILLKTKALRDHLGKPRCSDSASCFAIAIQLRDEFNLKYLILMKDPRTGLIQ